MIYISYLFPGFLATQKEPIFPHQCYVGSQNKLVSLIPQFIFHANYCPEILNNSPQIPRPTETIYNGQLTFQLTRL